MYILRNIRKESFLCHTFFYSSKWLRSVFMIVLKAASGTCALGAHEGTGAAVMRVERPLVVGVAGSGGQDRGLSFRSGRRLQM